MEAPKPALPFKCPESGCDKAFETQDQLEGHKNDAHLHIDDYLTFALENFAQGVGLNTDGTPKEPALSKTAEPQKQVAKTVAAATKSSTSPASAAMAHASSTQAAIKAESPAQPLPKTPSQQAAIKPVTAPISEAGTTTTDIKPTSADTKPVLDPAAAEAVIEDPLLKDPFLTDPWSTSILKPSELQDLFKPVDSFPTIIDNWEFPVDDPAWPNFTVEDLAEEPNTTPSAASKDTVDTIDSSGPATLADEEQGEEEKGPLADPLTTWMSWPEEDDIDFGYPWIEEMGEVLHPVEYKEGMTGEEKLQALDDAAHDAFAKDKVPGW